MTMSLHLEKPAFTYCVLNFEPALATMNTTPPIASVSLIPVIEKDYSSGCVKPTIDAAQVEVPAEEQQAPPEYAEPHETHLNDAVMDTGLRAWLVVAGGFLNYFVFFGTSDSLTKASLYWLPNSVLTIRQVSLILMGSFRPTILTISYPVTAIVTSLGLALHNY